MKPIVCMCAVSFWGEGEAGALDGLWRALQLNGKATNLKISQLVVGVLAKSCFFSSAD